MKLKNKLLVYLVIIAVFDMVIPIPFTAIFLIYVLTNKPVWFKEWVAQIYRS